MKKRIKNKIKKRLSWLNKIEQLEASTIEPIFCRVIVDMESLDFIGFPSELIDAKLEYIRDFPDGYSEIKYERKEFTELLGKPIFELYDIPKSWLKFE